MMVGHDLETIPLTKTTWSSSSLQNQSGERPNLSLGIPRYLIWFAMRGVIVVLCLVGLAACGRRDRPPSPREFQIQQSWQFQPGTQVAGHPIRGGLGDISVEIKGGKIYAPMSGQVQPHKEDCIIFTSAELPAYLLRLCGVKHPQLGTVRQGEAIASSQILSFAVLRKQPDGTWALVEPANTLLERVLTPSKA